MIPLSERTPEERSALAACRSLVPLRASWPVHTPRTIPGFRERSWEPMRTARLFGWRSWQHCWWKLWRPAFSTCMGNRRFVPAALVQLNAPTDAEIRVRCWPKAAWSSEGDFTVGIYNARRRLPGEPPFPGEPPIPHDVPCLPPEVASRAFGGRGIFPARPGDFLTLMHWCDAVLNTLWSPHAP